MTTERLTAGQIRCLRRLRIASGPRWSSLNPRMKEKLVELGLIECRMGTYQFGRCEVASLTEAGYEWLHQNGKGVVR